MKIIGKKPEKQAIMQMKNEISVKNGLEIKKKTKK